MRHIFRLNVANKGYTLFSGDFAHKFDEFPLDISSINITKNYLSAQKRLDSLMQIHVSRWNFCISNMNSNEDPIVAYSCLLPLEDDKGRTGISFIHAIEVDDQNDIADITACISQMLSSQSIIELNKNISGLAKGFEQSENTINFILSMFQEKYRSQPKFAISPLNPIKEIQHDCGGAWAIAWLAITVSHLGVPYPWEIYEAYSPNTNSISTISTYEDAHTSYSLTEYFCQVVRDHELLNSWDTRQFPKNKNTAVKKNIAPQLPKDETYQKKNKDEKGISFPSNVGLDSRQIEHPAEKQNITDSLPKKREQRNTYPSNGYKVSINGLYGNELELEDKSRSYRVTFKNCIAIREHQGYFEFHIIEDGFIFQKEYTLVLPKDDLHESKLDSVYRFFELYESRNNRSSKR